MEPRQQLKDAGFQVDVVSLKQGEIRGWKGKDWGDSVAVDIVLAEADPGQYAALVLPGGVINPDKLRMEPTAIEFIKAFHSADKPIAAICHGPWLLVEAGAVKGRTLTSWPSLRTDITNAGGEWVDKQVEVDQKLVTSRKPEDLPAFCQKLLSMLVTAIDERRLDRMGEQSFPASDPMPGPISIP